MFTFRGRAIAPVVLIALLAAALLSVFGPSGGSLPMEEAATNASGEISSSADVAQPAAKHGVCGKYKTKPKKCHDNDNDGIPDNRDKDDDNDGIKDGKDKDNDGDGVKDGKDKDDDGDGVPDKCEKKKGKKKKKCIANNT